MDTLDLILWSQKRQRQAAAKGKGGASWSSYWKTLHPEIATFDAGLTTPLTTAQIIELGEMMSTLKTNMGITSLTDAFDFLYLHGWVSEEVGLHNLVKNAHHATNHGGVWASGGGFTGNATDAYIDTNYNPRTEADKFTTTSAGFGIYLTTDRGYISTKVHGVLQSSRGSILILPERSFNQPRGAIGSASTDLVHSIATNGCIGLTSVYRSDGDTAHITRDKDTFTDFASALSVGGYSDGNIYLLAENLVGTGATYFDNVQILFSYAGKGLSQAQHNALYDALYGFFLT